MNALYKFFPIYSIFSLDNNTLTAWWVIITILYFIISLTYLASKTRTVVKTIIPLINSFSIEQIEQNSFLSQLWHDYQQTFIALEGERRKTFERAKDYFHYQNILAQSLNIRYWQAVPGMLVGLGILGTFVGLTVGIAEFKLDDIDTIKESICKLLAGMGTAFVSSVWGMLLSLIFGIFEKHIFNDVNKITNDFSSLLDSRYHITKAEEMRFQNEDQEEIIKKMFAFKTENGDEVLPSFVLRDIKKESEQQTKALKSFSTDLADGIRISSETISALGHHIADALKVPFNSELAPLLSRIEAAVQEVRQAKEELSAEVINRAMGNLQNALSGMGQEFHNALSGSISGQIEKLSEIITTSGNILLDLPNKLNEMMNGLETHIKEITTILNDSSKKISNSMDNKMHEIEINLKNMMQELQKGISDQQKLIQDTCKTAYQSSEEAIQRINTETYKVAESFRGVITSLQQNMEKLLIDQKDNTASLDNILQSSEKVFERGSDLIAKMGDALQAVQGSLTNFQQLSKNLSETSRSLNAGMASLQENMKSFHQSTETLNQSYATSFERLESALKYSESVARNYSTNFKVIQESLEGIFTQIQSGLNQYQEITKTSLNKYLEQFATHLTAAVESLGGGIEELRYIVEEIVEVKNKVSR